ncbi:MAG: TetR/AcrR family transcriptional regulator [Betaproteobacteria bacterium]|nr:MAG: TetR/AcrR family transcriptional regulator [Betaproteobacteria bacterium]TAG46345.1 MAG: TetR/AcrR family transcriptional regulator [Betaproteobacteria bacterium]
MSGKMTLPTVAALPANATARERILTAAVELLHTDGFASLTQQAVAAKAGLRQSHITYYFATRNELLRATAQYGCERMLAPIEGAAAAGQLTRESLRDVLLPDQSDRGFFRLMVGLLAACDEDESIKTWLHEFDSSVEKRIQATFAAVNVFMPDDVVHLMHASFVGAVHLESAWQTPQSLERARKTVALIADFVMQKYAVEPTETDVGEPARSTKTKTHKIVSRPRVTTTARRNPRTTKQKLKSN